MLLFSFRLINITYFFLSHSCKVECFERCNNTWDTEKSQPGTTTQDLHEPRAVSQALYITNLRGQRILGQWIYSRRPEYGPP